MLNYTSYYLKLLGKKIACPDRFGNDFFLCELEKSSIALATVYFYNETERKKGRFITVILIDKWYLKKINEIKQI